MLSAFARRKKVRVGSTSTSVSTGHSRMSKVGGASGGLIGSRG
jgi:hypothetical protein